jgi:hypothetical protein
MIPSSGRDQWTPAACRVRCDTCSATAAVEATIACQRRPALAELGALSLGSQYRQPLFTALDPKLGARCDRSVEEPERHMASRRVDEQP